MTEWVSSCGILLAVYRGKAIVYRFVCDEGNEVSIKEHCEDIAGEVLACGVLLNSYNGLATPHVLVSEIPISARANYKILSHGGSADGDSWKTVVKFQISEELCPESNNFHLLDGPCVIWDKGPYIHTACGRSMNVTSLDVRSVAPNLCISKVTKVWCESDYNPSPFIRLGVQVHLQDAISTREFGDREWLSIEVCLKGVPILNRALDFIPGYYGYIVTCITTLTEYLHNQFTGAVMENRLYIIGTELRQVIVVVDGKVEYVLSLDFMPQQLSSMKSSVGRLIVAARSASGEACAHELVKQAGSNSSSSSGGNEEDWTWTELGRWSGVRVLQTGDFLQTGSNQLLLLLSTDGEFILTNFCDLNIASHPPSEDEHERMEEDTSQTVAECPTSLLNVLKGLQLKKHAGEAQLVLYEASEQRKRHLLVRSLSFMEGLGCGTSTIPSPDPGLLCVIPGNLGQSTCSGSAEDAARELPKSFQVLNVWQRLCNDQWVLGILAKNVSQKSLKNASVSLIVPEERLVKDAGCRVVWNETLERKKSNSVSRLAWRGSAAKPPPVKRKKLASDVAEGDGTSSDRQEGPSSNFVDAGDAMGFTVHAKPSIPDQGAVLLVSWSEVSRDGLEVIASEELAHVQLEKIAVHKGELDIDKNCLELWQGEGVTLKDERMLSIGDFSRTDVQSLACLLAVHALTQVKVTSKYTNLWRLPSIIKAKFPSSKFSIQVSPLPHSGKTAIQHTSSRAAATPCPVSSTDMGGLGAMGCTALHIHLEARGAVISILSKRGSDKECLLKLLRDSLPGDISLSILAESQSKEHEHLLSSLSAIMEEAKDKAKEIRHCLTKGESRLNRKLQEPNLLTLTNIAMSELQL